MPSPSRLPASAPGFIPLRIGPHPALVLSDGPIPLPGDGGLMPLPTLREIVPGIPEAQFAACLEAAGIGAATHIDQNILLLEIAGRLVIFDTGCGDTGAFGPGTGRLPQSLSEAGLTPGDIDLVIFSHAHSDHAWGTVTSAGAPVFPNADYRMSRVEFDFWNGKPAEDNSRSVTGFRQRVLPVRDRMRLFDADEELLPGLFARATPGHTPGHSSFELIWPEGRFLILGDVVLHHAVTPGHPGISSLFDADQDTASATRLAMLGRMADEDIPAIGYHMPWPGLFRLRRDGAAFRFVPDFLPQPGR